MSRRPYRCCLILSPKPDTNAGATHELHLYGPEDTDHTVFGSRPCVGFLVDDVDATRRRMEALGILFLSETQRDVDREWAHYRGPDGTVYELIGPRMR
ncbi:VOC family protein [Ornithinimicrobium sp. LYQ121]|uniref:VOC family protein n=1 Tax=Ornithinimicrobium sp. LYQ121 TaxID=3378801 RepID=UPI003851AABA